ncbi:oligosaccharide flippase family protein [Geodermatophilus sp. SYSU D01106]
MVGYFSWMMLAYTAFQALTDTAFRHTLLQALSQPPDGRRSLLSTYRAVSALSGWALLVAAAILVAILNSDTSALLLLPLAFAPIATAVALPSLGLLQRAGRWATLARGQVGAAVVSLALGLPLTAATRSVLGPSVQLLTAEAIFAAYCYWAVQRLDAREVPLQGGAALSRADLRSTYASMAGYSTLGWAQGQSDRVLIGAVGGTYLLGQYGIAVAIARTLGDTLAAATANLLRVRLSGAARTAPSLRRRTEGVLATSLLVGAIAVACIYVLTSTVITDLLGGEWEESLTIVPILALATFPSILNWTSSSLLALSGRHRFALLSPTAGLVASLFIALAAAHGPAAIAWAVVVREYVVATTSLLLLQRHAPWKFYLLTILLVSAGGIVQQVLL